jgi:hypothetical protein
MTNAVEELMVKLVKENAKTVFDLRFVAQNTVMNSRVP